MMRPAFATASAIVLASLPLRLPAEQPVSVALHLHGSFSEGDGSMEWHADRARRAGVDVLWWTDHDWRIETWNHTRHSGFENATYDPEFAIVTEPDADFPGETTQWVRVSGVRVGTAAIVDGVAREGKRSFRLTAEDEWNLPSYRPFHFRHGASRQQNRFSLASRPRLSFSVYPAVFDPTRDKIVLEAWLSRHPDDRPVLRYVIGSLDEEDVDVVSLPFTPDEWNDYEIDVTADAIARFSAGGADTLRAEDNALVHLQFGVETRLGGRVVAHLDEFRIDRDDSLSGDDLLAKQRDIAAYWEVMAPDVRQLTGVEISRFRPQPHLTAYGPDPRLPDYTGHDETESLEWMVDQLHARGGVVSYAHGFGPWVYAPDDETEEERVRRVRERTRALVTDRLLGCDGLEVGYRWRGGANLDEHLHAWNALIANGVFVTGIGVNDSHGTEPFHGWAPWQDSIRHENNFVTWLWAETTSQGALLESLRAGRAFFGDPFAFSGSLDIETADGFPMGRIVLTDRAAHDVLVRMENVAPDIEVRFVQVEIREGAEYFEPIVLRDELLRAPVVGGVFEDRVTVNTEIPSFVRVEVRGAGEPLAFSNPLHFVREAPRDGIPAARLAATFADLRIEGAEGFRLTELSFEGGRRRLRIRGHEAAEGGSLVLRTGERGRPASVSGADTWSWDRGLLSLAGFGGESSSIEISWGAVGEAPEPIRAVALGPGRPRPGGGASATFALPRRLRVQVAVFAVDGRRVRTLVDEVRDAGEHVAAWDGRDARGNPVTSGVYFLRLEAAGERLTSRVVILR